jgi:putative transcriptional regulator
MNMARPTGKQTIRKKGLSPIARRIIESLEEYAAYRRGETSDVEVLRVRPNIPEKVDVKSIRGKLGMTQEQFTSFGFSLSAIRHWEARRRMPEGPARVLLMVIARNPSVVLEALHR